VEQDQSAAGSLKWNELRKGVYSPEQQNICRRKREGRKDV
jgi:hypothetical protein